MKYRFHFAASETQDLLDWTGVRHGGLGVVQVPSCNPEFLALAFLADPNWSEVVWAEHRWRSSPPLLSSRALADILRQQGPVPVSQYEHENLAAMDGSPKDETPVRTSKNHYTPVHGKASNHGRTSKTFSSSEIFRRSWRSWARGLADACHSRPGSQSFLSLNKPCRNPASVLTDTH